MGKQERTYQEDEYVDVGEEVARSWAEIEAWRASQPQPSTTTVRDVPNAQDCPPNAIGRTHRTVGDIMGTRGQPSIGGE